MKNEGEKKLVLELNKDQITYLSQILQQEKLKIESLNSRQISPAISKYQIILNNLIHTIQTV